jgi:hypothetical protein
MAKKKTEPKPRANYYEKKGHFNGTYDKNGY